MGERMGGGGKVEEWNGKREERIGEGGGMWQGNSPGQ